MAGEREHDPRSYSGLAPDAVPGHRILRVLGQGGMATVYAAQQEHPRRLVALKVMRPSIVSGHALRRFRKEIDVLARLRHPCIAQVYSAGTLPDGASELPYFTMEYIPGARTILQFAQAQQLDRIMRVKLFVQVCAAVEHGHRQRILHLDLKPGNVLLDNEGHVKVIDFGVARALDQSLPDMTHATGDTAIMGSLHAMSPEQIDPAGQDLDARSDVYSLGVLLYRLMLDVLPYELNSASIVQCARTICETPARPPREVDASLPITLEAVMLRALEKDRSLRFRSAGALGKALLGVLDEMKVRSGRREKQYAARSTDNAVTLAKADVATKHTNRNPRWMVVAAGVVVLMVCVVVAVLMIWRSDEPNATAMTHGANADDADGLSSQSSGAAPDPARNVPPAKPFFLQGHSGHVRGLDMNEAGDQLISSAQDSLVRVWNIESRSLRHALSGHESAHVTAVAIASDSTLAASGDVNGKVIVHDTAQGRVLRTFKLSSGPVHALAFAADGTLAAAGGDLAVRLWNADGVSIATLRSSTGAIAAGQFSSTGDVYVGGSMRGTVYVWDIASAKQITSFDTGDDRIVDLALAPDDRAITVLTERGVAMIFDRATGLRRDEIATVGETPNAMCLSDDGTSFFVARHDRTITCWDISSGSQIGETIDVLTNAVHMKHSSAANRLVVGFEDGTVQVIPLQMSQDAAEDSDRSAAAP